MKKGLFVLLTLSLLLCASLALAETYTCGDFEYALLENGDAELITYTGTSENVIIPNTLDGHPIMAVHRNPFYFYNSDDDCGIKNCTVSVAVDHPYLATINGVLFGQSDRKLISYFPSLSGQCVITQGIWEIGDYAFFGCNTLASVTIPDSVTSIGECTFAYCSSLTSVTIPDSVTSIGGSAFLGCTSITSVNIPNSVTGIWSGVFAYCSSLTSISIPNSITGIGAGAFFCCTSLTSLSIPASVTSIWSEAFAGCTSLTSVTIPDSVTSIGSDAFYDCPNLTIIVSPGSYAESYCIENGLTYVYADVTYGDNDSWLN